MSQTAATPGRMLERAYEEAAWAYSCTLTDENLMEATAQGTQRAITLESFALIAVYRPDVQCFNELLVQYPGDGSPLPPRQVVPDNLIVVHPEPIVAGGSFNTPFQPVGPFLVLEYVSRHNTRKDYERNLLRYQDDLEVPYYLLFYPDKFDLTVFRRADGRYSAVLPNDHGRLAVPELELEVALLDGWVRYWFRGDLLPLPGELLRQVDAMRAELLASQQATEVERSARVAAEQRAADAEAELARLRAELGRDREA